MYEEINKKTSTEILYIEVIKRAMGDALNVGNASEQSQKLIQSQAKNWVNVDNKDFRLICEHAGTEPEYILKLYGNLEYNYNSGKITKDQVKFGISRLDKKI